MPSPPPSSEMDFDFEGNWPASEVTNLTTDARTVATLPPTLATVLTTQKELILDEMDIQIGLIKSRSQDLGDGQVTIYDKALLDLTVNGIQVDNNSAIIFWCQHYCGTDPVNAPNNTARILQQKLAVRVVMNQAIETHQLHRLSGTTVKAESEDLPEPIMFSSKSTDPKHKRMFDVYDQARTEYLAVAQQNDPRTITAAKFLRDTAENALSMLKDTEVDAGVLQELAQTCDMAKNAVVELSGGKKRKFDGPQEEQMKKEQPVNHRRFEGRRSYGNGHGRGNGHYRGRGGRGGGGGGRGPSGIPYGYTREVDSYYPY